MTTMNLSGTVLSNSHSNESSSTSNMGSRNTMMHSPGKRGNEEVDRRHTPSSSISLGTSKASRSNSYLYQQTETVPPRSSGKLYLQPKEMPDFGEGTDQKVLPLPPVRSTPTDWFSHSPDRSCSSATNIDNTKGNNNVNSHPPCTPTYHFDRFSPNFMKESGQADPLSRIFLDAVERGDKSTVARCLKCSHPVNVNCTNMLGRTAIQIAVDNENFEIVELLLKEPNIRIGDALLYAVQEGVYRIVEMLIDHHSITKEMLGTSWSKKNNLSEESHDFSADISPVILASICNQFEILQLLLSRGARIERPHRSNCSCSDCATMYKEDSLKYSLWRINTYRALASPAWISLTSPDPILAAFKLSWELSHLASRENEFKEVFLQLSDQCKKYACDLLDQCRSKEEVLAVLSRSSDDEDIGICDDLSNDGGEDGTEHVEKSALRRTTTVIHRPSRRWHGRPLYIDNSFELGDLEATRLEPNKRLESQYTIVEDLANLESHKGQMYPGNEDGVKRKGEVVGDAFETDLDGIYDGEDGVENENDFEESEVELETPPLRLDRLKLAIKYEQKRFVAHPHCQHILTTLWYDQLPGWRKHHPIFKLLLCVGFVMALPFLALVYLVYPRGSVARILRSPLIKFVNHSASIAIFLILLLIASTDGQSVKALESRQMTRGPDPNRIELLIAWWVFGFVWSEMKQIWEEGFKAYVRQWWNWLDFIMLTLFLTTVGLRVVGLILRKTQRYGFDLAGREDWPPDDPTLVSEAFFAIAHIFSFARIIFLFQVNEHLGPLQISLGNMLIDITKFLFIFLLVITSFACGLHQLYYYYFSADNDMRPAAFSSLLRSYQALFWHLFGVTQINQYRLQTKDAEGKVVDLKSAQVTVTVGEILLMIYHAMAIIVLVNMLIAMMSNSFQTIQNQADTEWKFARSKLWLGYFDEGSTLPPPLNTIVSPKSIWRFGRGLIRLLTCSTTFASVTDDKSKSPLYRDHPRHRRRYSGTVKPFPPNQANSTTGNRSLWCDHSVEPTIRLPSSVNNENSKPLASNATDTPAALKEENTSSKKSGKKHSYQAITRILVRRYIHVSKKTMRQGIVNEDDLLEIKQDISSLRYELREDRQREVVRSIGHLEGLKYQLLSVLVPHHQQGQENCSTKGSSSSSSAASRPPQPPSHSVGSNETASIPGIKALGAQIQALSEEIRRISPGPNTPPLLSGLQATTATSEGLKGLKHEIIDEVKGELHSFARQLMQFMSQCQQPSGSNSGSETPAAPSVSANAPLSTSSLSPPRAPAPASSTPSINRERIGGVSVTYRGGAAAGLSLSAPRRAQPRHQR